MQTGVDSNGQPNVMGPPVNKLRKDFPLQPECMGKLVPQQINLWMGAARNGNYLPSSAARMIVSRKLYLQHSSAVLLLHMLIAAATRQHCVMM